jgi:hypothetical protein
VYFSAVCGSLEVEGFVGNSGLLCRPDLRSERVLRRPILPVQPYPVASRGQTVYYTIKWIGSYGAGSRCCWDCSARTQPTLE